jgi:hypothetical protein
MSNPVNNCGVPIKKVIYMKRISRCLCEEMKSPESCSLEKSSKELKNETRLIIRHHAMPSIEGFHNEIEPPNRSCR